MAENNLHKSFRLLEELNDYYGLAWYYFALASISDLMGDYNNAMRQNQKVPKNFIAHSKLVDIFVADLHCMNIDNRFLGIQLKPKGERNFYLLLFIALWAYIWLRAIFTQMTHDETANFFRFVQTTDFLPYGLDTSATNHLLNSFLSWISYSLFGAESWALRLGNILSFPVFFYFLVKLGSLLKNRFLRISFVVVLALTHNLIEFFAMSRGYGHSMAFLLAALWFLLRAFSTVSPRDYFLTLLFATLALTANLTLLNSVLLIVGFLTLRLITQQKFNFATAWKHWLIILITGIAPVIFFAIYLFHLKEIGDLYYGLTTGFWEVTVKSLVKTLFDPESLFIEIGVGVYAVFVFAFGMYFSLKNINIENLFSKHLLFVYLLLGSILAVVLLRIIFDVNYPEDRTGLYLLVYFVGSIFFISDLIGERFKLKRIYLVILPLLFVPFHFIFTLNLSHNSFENQKIPDRFFEKILEDKPAGEIPPTIGGYRMRVLRWAFLNYHKGSILGKVEDNLYPNTLEDYQIADGNYITDWEDLYNAVDSCESSKFKLLKRKYPAPKSLVFEKSEISSQGEIASEYFRFFITDADTLAGSTVQIIFDFHLSTNSKPFIGWVIANSLDANNQQIGYEYYPLEWLNKNWEGEDGHIINSMIVRLPEGIQQLNFYIWNKKQVPFTIEDASVKVMRFEESAMTPQNASYKK